MQLIVSSAVGLYTMFSLLCTHQDLRRFRHIKNEKNYFSCLKSTAYATATAAKCENENENDN